MNDEKSESEVKLDECIRERDEYLDGWKRAKADLINYKKEEAERMVRVIEYRENEIISEILEIAHNFKDAEKGIPEERIKDDETIKGFLRIKENLDGMIKKMGLEEIESVGKEFNPNLHEAVELVESEGQSGTVVEEISKGYTRNGQIVKVAKVKVKK